MENNLNYDKISFDNSSYNEQDINLTDSYNYNISDIQSIQNYNYASNQINIFEQQLYEYERNNFRKKTIDNFTLILKVNYFMIPMEQKMKIIILLKQVI